MDKNPQTKSRNVPSLIIDTLNQEKHDEVTDSSTGRPVCGQESTKCCVLTPKHVEEDQTGTGETRIGGSKRGARN